MAAFPSSSDRFSKASADGTKTLGSSSSIRAPRAPPPPIIYDYETMKLE